MSLRRKSLNVSDEQATEVSTSIGLPINVLEKHLNPTKYNQMVLWSRTDTEQWFKKSYERSWYIPFAAMVLGFAAISYSIGQKIADSYEGYKMSPKPIATLGNDYQFIASEAARFGIQINDNKDTIGTVHQKFLAKKAHSFPEKKSASVVGELLSRFGIHRNSSPPTRPAKPAHQAIELLHIRENRRM